MKEMIGGLCLVHKRKHLIHRTRNVGQIMAFQPDMTAAMT